jgi:hypothetical protein
MNDPLDTRPSLESKLLARAELQQSVLRLRSLVCELLIENERLRALLVHRGAGTPVEQPPIHTPREWTLA